MEATDIYSILHRGETEDIGADLEEVLNPEENLTAEISLVYNR